MTVQQLKEALGAYPGDMEVRFDSPDGFQYEVNHTEAQIEYNDEDEITAVLFLSE